jgi:hypothetical protein
MIEIRKSEAASPSSWRLAEANASFIAVPACLCRASSMRSWRETVERPFGTLKMRMGATHDPIVHGRGLRQRVFTQPRPAANIGASLVAV